MDLHIRIGGIVARLWALANHRSGEGEDAGDEGKALHISSLG